MLLKTINSVFTNYDDTNMADYDSCITMTAAAAFPHIRSVLLLLCGLMEKRKTDEDFFKKFANISAKSIQ